MWMRAMRISGAVGAGVIMVAMVAMPTAQQPAGRALTQEEMFRRNVGSREDQVTPFPPHRIVGNLYYVGTHSLSAFLSRRPTDTS